MTTVLDKPKIGRPSKRSPALARSICESIESGFSLRFTCSELGISDQFVLNWLKDSPEFVGQYALARTNQADFYADEIVEIADESKNDLIKDETGAVVAVDHENINRSRLRVDARKWVAAKLLPKKYGDNVAQFQINNTVNMVVLSEEKRLERIERRQKLLSEMAINSSTLETGLTPNHNGNIKSG